MCLFVCTYAFTHSIYCGVWGIHCSFCGYLNGSRQRPTMFWRYRVSCCVWKQYRKWYAKRTTHASPFSIFYLFIFGGSDACQWLLVFKRSPSTQKCRENRFLLLIFFLLLSWFGCVSFSLCHGCGVWMRAFMCRVHVYIWWWFPRCHKLQSNAWRDDDGEANRSIWFFFLFVGVRFCFVSRTSRIWDIEFLFRFCPLLVSKRL